MKPNHLFITVLLLIFLLFIPHTFAQDLQDTILAEHEDDINSIAFSPDGQTLASGSDDDTVVLWDVTRREQKVILKGHERTVYSVAFSPDGQTLASGSGDGTVILWDVTRREQKVILKGHEETVYSVAFSPDGQTLASGSRDDTVILWDAASKWRKTILKEHRDWVYSVAFSPDGQTLASGSGDGTVILWDVARKRRKATLEVGRTRVYSVAFSPDGQTLASGHWDRTVILWDVAHEERKITLTEDPLRAVYSVAFSPDGQTLASGNADGIVILWNAVSGEQKATLLEHKSKVNSLAFGPDGSKLASGSNDGTIRLWDTNLTVSPKIVFESQEIDDGFKGLFGWSKGNANGVAEIGESITFIVTLRNKGEVEAKNVKGVLSTKDKRIENIIFDREVDYGNIGRDKISPIHPVGRPLFSDILQIFKLKIPSILASRDAIFTLTVTADNGGPWVIPITVPIINPADTPIINPANIGIKLPDDIISEVAFAPNSTYFILNAQFPTLTGIDNADLFYEGCIITLNLLGVPAQPRSDHGTLNDPGYFMFPLKTPQERLDALDEYAYLKVIAVAAGTTVASGIAGAKVGAMIGSVIPVKGTTIGGAVGFLIGAGVSVVGVWNKETSAKDVILRATADPFFDLIPSKSEKGMTGKPRGSARFLFLIPRQVRNINIRIEQEFRIESETRRFASDPTYTETENFTWNLADGTFSAPSKRLMSLADYLPFQSVPPEVQAYLLRHFPEPVSAGTWQIPEQTSVFPNYPNPFNPDTWIPYQLTEPADVTLTIYDTYGRVVHTLDLGHQRAGVYQSKNRAAYWNGKNAHGELVASGLYFYTLKAGDFTATRKMLIQK